MVLANLEKGNLLLKESNSKFENLLDSTNTLFRLSDELLHENVEIDESYLIQMFNIATTVFENYDYASCYIKSEEEVKFIAAYGYDTKILNKYFDDLEALMVPKVFGCGKQVKHHTGECKNNCVNPNN